MLTRLIAAAALLAASALPAFAQPAFAQPGGGRLADIRARGTFKCGVYENVPGLAALDTQGHWAGFDVDYCRAMASSILGSADKVEFVKMTFAQGIQAVKAGEVDMAGLAITATVQRETELGLDFVGPTLYSGQGFMVHKRTGATKLADLGGAAICIVAGSNTESLLDDFFRSRGLTFKPVAVDSPAQLFPQYEEGRCDVVTMEPPFLAMRRARLKTPTDHIILPDMFTKSDMGPIIRDDDVAFAKAVQMTHWALVTAEELGVTAANVDDLAKTGNAPATRRLLGVEGTIGSRAGLVSDTFAQELIRDVGNYAEIWERNLGRPLGLERGPNRLVRDGGQQWAPLWR